MTNTEEKVEIQAPLERLLELLHQNFPLSAQSAPLKEIDSFLRLSSNYSRTVYESAIYFLARRLVTLAGYSVSQSPLDNPQEVIYAAISEVFDLGLISDPEYFVMIVYECQKLSEKKPNPNIVSRQTSTWLAQSKCCYICGTSLVLKSDPVTDNAIEAEHKLPRSLGAGNSENALRPACHKCNQFKKDRIGSADLHHESLAYKFSIGSPRETDYYRFAAMFFNDGKCGICGTSAENSGTLKMRLREPTDSWHLFNIFLICDSCENNTSP